MSAGPEAVNQAGQEPEQLFTNKRVETTNGPVSTCTGGIPNSIPDKPAEKQSRNRQSKQPQQWQDLTNWRLPLMIALSIAFLQVCSQKPAGGYLRREDKMSNQVCEGGGCKGQG